MTNSNFDKIVHVMYEVHNVKPPDLDERAANIAAQLMDQVDAGVKPDISLVQGIDGKVADIAIDYFLSFNTHETTDDEWEVIRQHETPGFFDADRRPHSVAVLHWIGGIGGV